jgi:hypothetical protein
MPKEKSSPWVPPPMTKIGTPGAAYESFSILSSPWLSGRDRFAKIAHIVFWLSRSML